MLIKSMGLFWLRTDVFWGTKGQGNCGTLLGLGKLAKRKGIVDFWEQVGVYALYTADYELVYVGQAGAGKRRALGDRLKDHTKDELAGRWDFFSWFGVRSVNKSGKLQATSLPKRLASGREVLNVLETICIEVAEPSLNWRRGHVRGIQRYLQYRDAKRLGHKPEEAIIQLQKDVAKLQASHSDRRIRGR